MHVSRYNTKKKENYYLNTTYNNKQVFKYLNGLTIIKYINEITSYKLSLGNSVFHTRIS